MDPSVFSFLLFNLHKSDKEVAPLSRFELVTNSAVNGPPTATFQLFPQPTFIHVSMDLLQRETEEQWLNFSTNRGSRSRISCGDK